MDVETLILGAGAAGLMCAAHAGGRCLVVDHAAAAGEKIRISGGGRCNFTNLGVAPERFLGRNPHFAKSALARYTQWDFLDLVGRHGIPWHEKTLGQLFCDRSARDITGMLLAEAAAAGAEVWLGTEVGPVERAARAEGGGFRVALRREGRTVTATARRVVVATGGRSIPKMGATGRAYEIARAFGLAVTETRPGLVPLTFPDGRFRALSGVSVPAAVAAGGARFAEAVLFTHRGLSGPAILQVSSYWREGEAVALDLLPGVALAEDLAARRREAGRRAVATLLAERLPARLVEHLGGAVDLGGRLADWPNARLAALETALADWRLVPGGSEGWRTAEVTVGGVDTDGLSARTMEAKAVPGLYFVGECVDVTGWLGGYNFQWAWSSGWAAGTAIAAARG